MPFTASCSRGLEAVLHDELTRIGATGLREGQGVVHFDGGAEAAMRACLWSRTASRILQPLARFDAGDADAIYAAARQIDWPALFDVDRRFAVEVAGQHPAIAHTHHAGLRVKDAIADTFRDATGSRPSVDTRSPDLRVHLHLGRQTFTIGLDWAGDALHRRGYRGRTGQAPLKESLAAALLLRAGWPERAARGEPFVDPMCGSGTLAIEAAWIAADIAPGLGRRFAFEQLRDFDRARWAQLRAEAENRRKPAGAIHIFGSDIDSAVIKAARANAEAAGVADRVRFEVRDFSRTRPPFAEGGGLIVTNPPFGERLGNEVDLVKLYSLFGAHLRQHFAGWQLALLSPRTDLTTRLGLRSSRQSRVFNGPLECALLECPVPARPAAPPADDFINRIDKNLRRLRKWSQKAGVENYRIYDADLPEYALAVDRYLTQDGLHLFVQEYAPPRQIDPVRAEKRLRSALAALQSRFELDSTRLHFRRRARQRGQQQYRRHGERGTPLYIEENGCRLMVRLDEFQDTGIFLDHRAMRRHIAANADGIRFLNLFCYTASASVAAARGGARLTVSVDMSNTYLDWAETNFTLNKLPVRRATRLPLPARGHVLLRADCLKWPAEAASDPSLRFDRILLDPPSFSNSTRMEASFDVQRDHVALIQGAAALLADGGELLFSTNRRRFRLDEQALSALQLRETTARTVDPDYARPRPPHRSWSIRRA